MHWFKENSAAIQALSSLTMVIVTGAYVRLTHHLSRDASRSRLDALLPEWTIHPILSDDTLIIDVRVSRSTILCASRRFRLTPGGPAIGETIGQGEVRLYLDVHPRSDLVIGICVPSRNVADFATLIRAGDDWMPPTCERVYDTRPVAARIRQLGDSATPTNP